MVEMLLNEKNQILEVQEIPYPCPCTQGCIETVQVLLFCCTSFLGSSGFSEYWPLLGPQISGEDPTRQGDNGLRLRLVCRSYGGTSEPGMVCIQTNPSSDACAGILEVAHVRTDRALLGFTATMYPNSLESNIFAFTVKIRACGTPCIPGKDCLLSRYSLVPTCVLCLEIEEEQLYSFHAPWRLRPRLCLARKPLVIHLRDAFQVLQKETQCLNPGDYRVFNLSYKEVS